MKKFVAVWAAVVLLLTTSAPPLYAYKIRYAEQWYKLYHEHLHQYPEESYDNLVYLQEALKADFANPLYALAKINDKREWEVYRYLFKLHSNLQVVRTYLRLGAKYDKRNAYFYNAPWKEQNIASLNIAEKYYRSALYYWNDAQKWAEKANDKGFRWIYLPEIPAWYEDLRQMNDKELDFGIIVDGYLSHLDETRKAYQAMDDTTY